MPSHLTSHTSARSTLYFSISLVTELRAPALYRFPIFQVNFISSFAMIISNYQCSFETLCFYSVRLLDSLQNQSWRITPDRLVNDLLNTFADNLYIWRSILPCTTRGDALCRGDRNPRIDLIISLIYAVHIFSWSAFVSSTWGFSFINFLLHKQTN